jgi:myo-inositol-1(or 4)-monophosphatase
MKKTLSLARALAVARAAAREAGALQRRNVSRRKRIGTKGYATNLVTDTDRASERVIMARLQRAFPHHGILSEETAHVKPAADLQWYVDPLDGTTNFAHGFPMFCVSIALAKGNRPLVGVVYQPMLDHLFCAVRGKGATLNGRRIRVSRTRNLSDALLGTGFPFDARTSVQNNLNYFAQFVGHARAIRRAGSAAYDLCAVAAGWYDGFWETKLNAWDVAAGLLLIEEAGGRTSDYQGGPANLHGRTFVVSNGRIHDAMFRVMRRAEANPIRIR